MRSETLSSKKGSLPRSLALWLGIAIALLVVGRSLRSTPAAPTAESPVHFVDITRSAGINFTHYTGAFGKRYLPETMGAGCAFIDYDNDGRPDILLIDGADFPGHQTRRTTLKLYHNNGDGTFTDVTAKAGLDVPMYGMGVAVGDYDNDGWDDIYVTGLGEARLFHNEHGHFRDVTKTAGVNNAGFGASAAWVDYDRDGKLDLFVRPRRPAQILLHARGLPGRYLPPVPQSRQRALRGCHREVGHLRSDVEIAGCRGDRLR